MTLRFRRLSAAARPPAQAHEGDAGYDLHAAEALTIAPGIRGNFVVDHAKHDSTSIMATIEHRFGLAPVSSRDAAVRDMSTVLRARPGNGRHRGHRH